jgi:hypothetical protein
MAVVFSGSVFRFQKVHSDVFMSKSAAAALSCRTDTLAESDKVDVVSVGLELSKAIESYSIARFSHHKEAGRRLDVALNRMA